MKRNFPVTDIEHFPVIDRPIVSKTDKKGVITYANESFVAASGFTREELIGKSHNIVRHPDMPPEAFADLWRTLKAGKPWYGVVKNRCKNGDFYWVGSYVTPLTERGRLVGYISVRAPVDRTAIEAADRLYRDVREKRLQLPATLWAAPYNAFLRLTLPSLAGTASAISGGLLDGAAGIGLGGLAAALFAYLAIEVRRKFAVPARDVADAVQALDEGQLSVPVKIGSGPLADIQTRLEGLRIHLHATLCDLRATAEDVDARTGQLERDTRKMVGNLSDQGNRVQIVAGAIDALRAAVQMISASTETSLAAAQSTEKLVEGCRASSELSVTANARLVSVVEKAQAQMNQVRQSVEDISTVTSLIREIAEQTNLLALNAAIEAARAGGQGRGFAVVADEIRKLAERTSASTSHIAETVQTIQGETTEATHDLATVASDVAQVTVEIRASGHQLDEILLASMQLTQLAETTRQMLDQQTHASQEIAQTMEQITAIAETSRQAISQIGAATLTLKETAAEMHRLTEGTEA